MHTAPSHAGCEVASCAVMFLLLNSEKLTQACSHRFNDFNPTACLSARFPATLSALQVPPALRRQPQGGALCGGIRGIQGQPHQSLSSLISLHSLTVTCVSSAAARAPRLPAWQQALASLAPHPIPRAILHEPFAFLTTPRPHVCTSLERLVLRLAAPSRILPAAHPCRSPC